MPYGTLLQMNEKGGDILKLQMDLSKEYGLVLEGGGAKGAYQIGAWKALKEVGIKIKGISGVSVGALNGAMVCMDDLDNAVRLWENISYSRIMDVEDDLMEKLMKGKLSGESFGKLLKDSLRFIIEGGVDVTPLKTLIEESVCESTLRDSSQNLYITTYSVSEHKLLDVDVKDVPEGLISDMLLASAYFLAFKNQKLHGKKYMDGGGWDNVPLGSLIERGYKDIIVLRIYGIGVEKKIEIPGDVNIYNVAPRQSLGKTLEFDRVKSRKNIKLGYYDCMRLLYGLEGRHYYLDVSGNESYYFYKLLKHLECPAERVGDVQNHLNPEKVSLYRTILEVILPNIASELKLKPDWTYKDLYLGILERAARALRVQRFNIYTEEELLKEVFKKAETARKLGRELPIYIDILDSTFVLC